MKIAKKALTEKQLTVKQAKRRGEREREGKRERERERERERGKEGAHVCMCLWLPDILWMQLSSALTFCCHHRCRVCPVFFMCVCMCVRGGWCVCVCHTSLHLSPASAGVQSSHREADDSQGTPGEPKGTLHQNDNADWVNTPRERERARARVSRCVCGCVCV